MNFKKYLIALLLFCIAGMAANAQVDTIRLKDKRLNTSYLKPELRQFLVYFQFPGSPKTLRFWYWLRDIKKETRNGENVFTITQHWYGSDTSIYRYCYSINRAADFAPIFHEENVRGITNAYNWGPDKITGADTVQKNAHKDFSLKFDSPNFNWNLDEETFEMLPLAAGKTFAINFYDAGLDPPAWIIYKVTGSEMLKLVDDKQIDCWKLVTEGKNKDGSDYSQTFWISKKAHEFLKEEDKFNGGYRYKVKMLGAATNLLPRFGK